jgi:MoaA/NifB/PqqE/SkfB family radical SAM enzyme
MTTGQYGYHRIMQYENQMLWHLNDLCNMACEYCFFPTGQKDDPEINRLSPLEKARAFDNTGRTWAIFMSGGEPLLYPNFIELVNLLKQKHYIHISTNLYNKNVKAFAEEVSPEHIININASSHVYVHNSKSLARFIENYHLFKQKGFDITVSYVTYPPLLKRMRQDFEFLKSQGIDVIIPLTYQGVYNGKPYPASYTREEILLIKELVHEPLELYITTSSMKFKNKLCKAGSNFFYMDVKGNVYRCATLNTVPMGNLFNGTFAAHRAPTPCPAEYCNDACFGITSQVEKLTPPVIPPEKSRLKNLLTHYYRQIFQKTALLL